MGNIVANAQVFEYSLSWVVGVVRVRIVVRVVRVVKVISVKHHPNDLMTNQCRLLKDSVAISPHLNGAALIYAFKIDILINNPLQRRGL